MNLSLTLEKSLKECSYSLLRDFTEIKNLQSSNCSVIEAFVSASLRKYIENFLFSTAEFIGEYRIHFPLYIDLFHSGKKILSSNILKKTNLYSKGIIEVDNNVVYFKMRNVKDSARVVFSPLDGISNFFRGIALFSSSLAIQELDNDKYFTTFAWTYDPIMHELFTADRILFSVNKIKMLASSNNDISKIKLCTFLYNDDTDFTAELLHFSSKIKNCTAICNYNLGLSYLASGRFDVFIANDITDENVVLNGMYFLNKTGIKPKIVLNTIDGINKISIIAKNNNIDSKINKIFQ